MSYGSLPGGRTLFLDLDGVMADFDGGFPAKFGFDHREVPDKVMWDAIEADGKFFRELPPCPGALKAYFNYFRAMSPVILTACPVSNFADVAEQKRAWVGKWLTTVDESRPAGQRFRAPPLVFTPGGKTKSLYMHRPGDILIDDFPRNVERWNEAGGFGILHTGDFNATIATLIGELCPKSQPAPGTSLVRSADHETTSPDTMMDTASASAVATTSLPTPSVPKPLVWDAEYPGPRC